MRLTGLAGLSSMNLGPESVQVNFSPFPLRRTFPTPVSNSRRPGELRIPSRLAAEGNPARLPRWLRRAAIPLLCGLVVAACAQTAGAQEERKPRLPVLSKLTTGSVRQAFSGKVQSLDLKRKLLMVDTVEGGATEIFPVKKDVPVSMVDGEKIKLKELKAGTSVLIYYRQKNDRRAVSEIIVLSAGAEEKDAKKTPPPS
jgi:hypothetical protein